jgi:periplasmic protein TonB
MSRPVSNPPLPEVALMFKESLLESSNIARKDKRWPMTLAFVLEMIAVSFLLLVPLMSTGVIPVLAHVPLIAPMHSVEVADHTPAGDSGKRGMPAAEPTRVVSVANNNRNALPFGPVTQATDPSIGPFERFNSNGPGPQIGNLICKTDCTAIARPAEPVKRLRFSHLSEALLVHRVDPVYPRTAIITHTFGAVQLHAIIARDGSIQSLNVISGNPILAQAALEAVRQWRYNPYMLNDEAVEVETFITVNFRSATN